MTVKSKAANLQEHIDFTTDRQTDSVKSTHQFHRWIHWDPKFVIFRPETEKTTKGIYRTGLTKNRTRSRPVFKCFAHVRSTCKTKQILICHIICSFYSRSRRSRSTQYKHNLQHLKKTTVGCTWTNPSDPLKLLQPFTALWGKKNIIRSKMVMHDDAQEQLVQTINLFRKLLMFTMAVLCKHPFLLWWLW